MQQPCNVEVLCFGFLPGYDYHALGLADASHGTSTTHHTDGGNTQQAGTTCEVQDMVAWLQNAQCT